MKKLSLTIAFLIVAICLFAQEKLTEEQAATLIAQYQERQIAAENKLNEEKGNIDALKNELAVLDAEIANLSSRIAELNAAKESGVSIPGTEEQYSYYVVKPGDFLAKLAEYPEVYGHGNYAMWPKIYHANKDKIKDPTLIYPNQKLRIPR